MKFCLLFLLGSGFLHALADEITLADATASASVERSLSPPGFKISVIFRPVTTLDEISNGEMTEILAQFYADEALSFFLKVQKAIIPSKTKSSFEKVNEGNERWNFIVPEFAVIDAPIKAVEIRGEVIGKKARQDADARMKILDFRSSCFRDLRVAETMFAEKVDVAKNDKDVRDALRQKILDAFSALRRKIITDDDLFRVEKDELVKKAERVEEFLMARIKGDDSDFKVEVNSRLIKDAVFASGPFRDLLMSDSILLTHGGARMVEMKDGSIAILSVGFANAYNEDREDIAELKASAELGKLQAGEEAVVANKIERHYSRSTKDGKTDERLETSRMSTTTVNSIDFHKMGETVGTWLSKDGKRFFMAKGRIVSAAARESRP